MNEAPDKSMRRVTALLAQVGLLHWRTVLDDLIRRYAGLEDITIGLDEGARPEIVALLRTLHKNNVHRPDDRQFAHAIADLGFLDYQVHRVVDDHMTDERWNPGQCSLADYRAAGDITAYPVFDRTTPAGLTAMGLLRQVRQHGEH